MTSTGENLRSERERRGLSLDDLSATTKIQKRHLQAIERSEYDDLPGEVFAKGYVKSYADALGLDSARIADEYTRERRGGDTGGADGDVGRRTGSTRAAFARLAELGPPAGSPSRARLTLLAAALVVTLVVAVGYVLWPDPDGDVATTPAPVAGVDRDAGDVPTSGDRGAGVATETPATETRTGAAVENDGGDTPPGEDAGDGDRGDGGAERDALSARDHETSAPGDDASDATGSAAEPSTAAPVASAPTPPVESRRTSAEPEVPEPPAADASPAAPAPTAARPARLAVPEFGVGTGVRNLQLVGRGDVFREGQELSFWTRVVGGSRGDAIRHVWIHEGRQVASIRLRIGGSHWRTHSSKRLVAGSAGDWAVEARDGEGRVLARSTFSCLPGRAP